MTYFFTDEMSPDTGLTKDPEGLTAMEKGIFNYDSTGRAFFDEGLRSLNMQRDITKSALKAWASYESYS